MHPLFVLKRICLGIRLAATDVESTTQIPLAVAFSKVAGGCHRLEQENARETGRRQEQEAFTLRPGHFHSFFDSRK